MSDAYDDGAPAPRPFQAAALFLAGLSALSLVLSPSYAYAAVTAALAIASLAAAAVGGQTPDS